MWDVIANAISVRSFSSLWYWIAVGVFWASATRQVMGVPHDVVARARHDALAMAQLEALAGALAARNIYYWQRGQIAIVALAFVILTLVSVLAFGYGFELAQAVWFLVVPMVWIAGLSLRAAHLVVANCQQSALLRVLFRFRIYHQLIAFVFIFVNVSFAFFHLLVQGFLG